MATSLSFTKFVWKNLRRRRLRTLLTLGGIGMAVGAFVGLVGFSRVIRTAMDARFTPAAAPTLR